MTEPTQADVERAQAWFDALPEELRGGLKGEVATLIAQVRAETLVQAAEALIESRTCKVVHSYMPSQCETCFYFGCNADVVRALSTRRDSTDAGLREGEK